MNELPHKPADEVIKYKDLEEVDITCADCEEQIFHLLKIKPADKTNKLIVKCPFCEGESWLINITGDYFQKSPDDLVVDEMFENEDGVMIINMKGADDG